MFKDIDRAVTNYCPHTTPNTSGICNDCLGKKIIHRSATQEVYEDGTSRRFRRELPSDKIREIWDEMKELKRLREQGVVAYENPKYKELEEKF